MSEYRLFPNIWRMVKLGKQTKRLTEDQQNPYLTLKNKTGCHRKCRFRKNHPCTGKSSKSSKARLEHLVCYNYMLRLWFEHAMPEEFREMVTIDTYHGMVEAFCKSKYPFFAGPLTN